MLTSEKTATKTGDFEVQVVDGPLLHSKKNGDGLVSNEERFDKICEGINKLLSSASAEKAPKEVPSKNKTPVKKGRNASTTRKVKEVVANGNKDEGQGQEEAPKKRGRKPAVNKEDVKKSTTRAPSTSKKTAGAAAATTTKRRPASASASASAPKRGRSPSSKRARK